MTIRLPLPPSVNAMYVNVVGRGRRKSGVYKAWVRTAGTLLNIQRPAKVSGPYEIEIRVPLKMRGDADNRIKPLLDLLVAHGVTDDDKHAKRVSISRADVLEAEIEVRAA